MFTTIQSNETIKAIIKIEKQTVNEKKTKKKKK